MARSAGLATLILACAGAVWAGDGAIFAMPQGGTYRDECGSCHTAYAPALLPASAWRQIMRNLDRHYGTDASLAASLRDQLGESLDNLAADRGGATTLTGRLASAPPASLRITDTRLFHHLHDEVPAEIWRRAKVGGPGNCVACHRRADEGRYVETDIRIPPAQ